MSRINEIRERLEDITPGLWTIADTGVLHIVSDYRYENGRHIANWIAEIDSDDENEHMESDAEFISRAPDDIRFLLNEIERLEKRIIHLEKIEKHYLAIMDESIEVAEGGKPYDK